MRARAACDDRVGGVVEERDTADGRNILQSKILAELEAADVDLDVLRDVRRQRLDVELPSDLLDDAADLRSGRLADEMHEDGGLIG